MEPIEGAKPFVDEMPSARNGLELFAGEWASKLPEPFATFRGSGAMALFEDERITWANEKLLALGVGGFADANILELGPLEGGHSFMMSRMGAKSVLALEANARAFLKCLVAKEALGMPNVTFWLGNALRYLRESNETFDLGVACAFLNHTVEPVEVIELLARRCRTLFIWNITYDNALFEKMPEMKPNFGPGQAAEWRGFKHTLYPHYYGQVESYKRFWGGLQPSCCWLSRDDILGALKAFGFARIESRIEDNPFGKAVAAVAVHD